MFVPRKNEQMRLKKCDFALISTAESTSKLIMFWSGEFLVGNESVLVFVFMLENLLH